MSKVQVQVDVAEHAYNALGAAGDLVAVIKKELANGWEPAHDIPAIISEAVRDLAKVAQNAQGVRDELAGDKSLVVNAIAVGGAKLVNQVAL